MIKYISLLEKYNEMLFLEAARKGQIKTGEIKKLQSKSLTQNVYDPDSILL